MIKMTTNLYNTRTHQGLNFNRSIKGIVVYCLCIKHQTYSFK